MKIGYVGNQNFCISGPSNGIRKQALVWKQTLEDMGHQVELINTWGEYKWKDFDIIHSFGFLDSNSIISQLKSRGCKIVNSPIIDTTQSIFQYKLASFWGSKILNLSSPRYCLRQAKKNIDLFLARSEFEKSYIVNALGVQESNVDIVPLSYNSFVDLSLENKENFCFHLSSITQARKNVMRLIQSAIKYKFNLVLAGSTGTEKSYAPFKKLIDANDNITCLGFISEDQLVDLYRRAKVFALPSINEGVGLVALDAAMYGCDVVITNIGGPKEYYADNAYLVNPYSVDDIGMSIVQAMSTTKQPDLYNHIVQNYSLESCVSKLESLYKNLLATR